MRFLFVCLAALFLMGSAEAATLSGDNAGKAIIHPDPGESLDTLCKRIGELLKKPVGWRCVIESTIDAPSAELRKLIQPGKDGIRRLTAPKAPMEVAPRRHIAEPSAAEKELEARVAALNAENERLQAALSGMVVSGQKLATAEARVKELEGIREEALLLRRRLDAFWPLTLIEEKYGREGVWYFLPAALIAGMFAGFLIVGLVRVLGKRRKKQRQHEPSPFKEEPQKHKGQETIQRLEQELREARAEIEELEDQLQLLEKGGASAEVERLREVVGTLQAELACTRDERDKKMREVTELREELVRSRRPAASPVGEVKGSPAPETSMPTQPVGKAGVEQTQESVPFTQSGEHANRVEQVAAKVGPVLERSSEPSESLLLDIPEEQFEGEPETLPETRTIKLTREVQNGSLGFLLRRNGNGNGKREFFASARSPQEFLEQALRDAVARAIIEYKTGGKLKEPASL